MSNEINFQLKNKLASSLAADWNRFAEAIPLSRNEIVKIEQEERDVEERVHRVLLSWNQRNPEEFTAANVKTKLKSILRNDIILDIFGSG